MATISDELQSFYAFAEVQLREGLHGKTLDELYAEWRASHPPAEELETDVRAVRAALRDMEAGETGRPIEEFAADFRKRNGI